MIIKFLTNFWIYWKVNFIYAKSNKISKSN